MELNCHLGFNQSIVNLNSFNLRVEVVYKEPRLDPTCLYFIICNSFDSKLILI